MQITMELPEDIARGLESRWKDLPRAALESLAEDWIKAEGSSPLAFRAATAGGSVTLKPLNQFWGRFATYWTVS